MATGLPLEYWQRMHDDDPRLTSTAIELLIELAGGKPDRGRPPNPTDKRQWRG